MSRDIHKKPFDEGTKAKLAIFRDYLKEWLPVFFAKKKEIYYPQINIYDFFSDPGTDGNGSLGTPLIILRKNFLCCIPKMAIQAIQSALW